MEVIITLGCTDFAIIYRCSGNPAPFCLISQISLREERWGVQTLLLMIWLVDNPAPFCFEMSQN